MTDRPKVSILLPVYNVEKYIGRCIDSILSQTFSDFELIIVDDASPDRSIEIAYAFANRDERIKIIRKEQNEGLMCARRTGYQSAKGEFIVFCDSDDYLEKDAINVLYNSIIDSCSDVVFANYIRLECHEKYYMRRKSCSFKNMDDVIRGLISRKMRTYLWGCIFRSHLFDYSYDCLLNQTINEDFILLSQILQNCQEVSFIDDYVYVYSINKESSTGSGYTRKRFLQGIRAMRWLLYSSLERKYRDEVQRNLIKRTAVILENGLPYCDILKEFPDLKSVYSFSNRRRYYNYLYCIFTSLLAFSPVFCRSMYLIRMLVREVLKSKSL